MKDVVRLALVISFFLLTSTVSALPEENQKEQHSPLVSINIGESGETNDTGASNYTQNATAPAQPPASEGVRGMLVILALVISIAAGLLYWKWDSIFKRY
ncbi:MAG: hypothetical protein HYS81_01800 [Candidatus Aenigmatarchaeota archaeon]|nr:MAG: hypothetical protein HYS81_01800 [Candidatus Aenigmarchaeota archaeon]